MTKRRADAARNRELLLRAGEAVFLESGINAPLDLIAERAGLGRATLFRNFPDRAHLISALLMRLLDEIEREADGLRGDEKALQRLIEFVTDRCVHLAPLHDYWRGLERGHPDVDEAHERFALIFTGPLRQAVAAGTCRHDIDAHDVVILISMISGALTGRQGGDRRDVADRCLSFVHELVDPAYGLSVSRKVAQAPSV